jgi:hypothetical protein
MHSHPIKERTNRAQYRNDYEGPHPVRSPFACPVKKGSLERFLVVAADGRGHLPGRVTEPCRKDLRRANIDFELSCQIRKPKPFAFAMRSGAGFSVGS